MNKKHHRIAANVKADILRRVKEEGISVAQAAKDHGISEGTIYGLDGKRSNRCPVLGGVLPASEAEQRTPGTRGRDHAQALHDPKKQLSEGRNKSALARALGISRASLYYVPRMKEKDWRLKVRLEEELQIHPSYGSRRIATALGLCRQRAQRVMRLFGIKPYRRRGRKWRKSKGSRTYPNLLLAVMPAYANHIWAEDFTEFVQHGKKVYVATVIDLYARRILGIQVAVRKGTALTIQALSNALLHHPRPGLFHSDNGREYDAMAFTEILDGCGIVISRSRPGVPLGERIPGIVLRQIQG